jgi:erythromycin esterase
MSRQRRLSRRQFVVAASTAGIGTLAGCASSAPGDGTTTPRSNTPTQSAGAGTPTPSDGAKSPVSAIEAESVPIALSGGDGLDSVASTLASAPIVGIGENSHGIQEFKTLQKLLVERLVAAEGYRLIAIEGTLGEFGPVNEYVTGTSDDLDSALSGLEFYFWQTEAIRQLFEWLRSFNDGRPADDQAVVYGYDAQFHDVNATALRSYFKRVDPDYLNEVQDRLDPLTQPLYEQDEVSYMTDAQTSLISDLQARLHSHETAYVDASSRSAWKLARRHVWTLNRSLQFQQKLRAHKFTQGKTIRDAAMARNVRWLREWAGKDRTVVLGNSNHTMRGSSGSGGHGARMGQHLTETFGEDYYSLGLLFGSGQFRAPQSQPREPFSTYELGEPTDGTPAATLVDVQHPEFFLDLESARERARIDSWLDTVSDVQFSTPSAADRGSVPLPAAPGTVYDGIVFVQTASPSSFEYRSVPHS